MGANSFPDGRRGRVQPGDTSRVAEYTASTLPRGGPGTTSRRFPSGTTVTPLPARRTSAASGPPAPLTVVDASGPDAQGNNPHPGRVRVYNGFIGLWPQEMHFPDAVLPDGTDNHCYLTMQPGANYVYGKVLVDGGTGLYTQADVYGVTSDEQPDGTYAYLPIATVNYGSALAIYQIATGHKSLRVVFSADGSIISPEWLPLQS